MSKGYKGDVPGNAMGSVAAYQKEMLRTAEIIQRVDELLQRLYEEGCDVTAFRVKAPDMTGMNWMVIGYATIDGASWVSFQAGDSFKEALVGWLNRLENRSLKWKLDEYKK